MDKGDLVFALLSAMATFAAVAIIYLGSLSGAKDVENTGWQILIGWWLLFGTFWVLTLVLQPKGGKHQ
ncbi:hypothetical protein ABOONEI_2300 [Aciduliprofundum boonei T469]|nr:hypothetical protein ABOONEI_2300 [Aciduliprofundum boonei T469]